MRKRLQQEIKQRQPFASLEQEVFLNVLHTADALGQAMEQMLRPAGLSHTQYNVLRILRGAGDAGLSCRAIAARMLTHDPDITRLLDRLERHGLVTRRREQSDRRVVTAHITSAGLSLLQNLDAPVAALHRRLLGHLGPERLAALAEMLEQARAVPAPERESEVVSGE